MGKGELSRTQAQCRHSTRFGCEIPKFKDKPDFPPTTTALRVQCLGAQESPALSSLGLAKALAPPWGVFFPARKLRRPRSGSADNSCMALNHHSPASTWMPPGTPSLTPAIPTMRILKADPSDRSGSPKDEQGCKGKSCLRTIVQQAIWKGPGHRAKGAKVSLVPTPHQWLVCASTWRLPASTGCAVVNIKVG